MKFHKFIPVISAMVFLCGCMQNNNLNRSSNPFAPSSSELQISSETKPPYVPEISMWTGFGKDYNGEILRVVNQYNEDHEGDAHITHVSQNNYSKLFINVSNSIDGRTYPHLVNGYPDHFAEYCHKGVMIPLNRYIENYNQTHNTNLMDDFYAQYTKENAEIRYDSVSREGYIMGLPFNKSTEVIVCNGFLADYIRDVDPSIIKLPETWQELATIGPKIVEAMKTNKYGMAITDSNAKLLIGTVSDGHASNFRISSASQLEDAGLNAGEKILQDVSRIAPYSFRVLGYDSPDNAFITMLRQWGAKYTEFSADIFFNNHEYGYATFWDDANKAKTLEGLKYWKDLYDANLIGLPYDWNLTNFCTDAFEEGNCLFSICSSGTLSNSTDPSKRIEVRPVLYYNDGARTSKAVISQGTSLGLMNQFSSKDHKEAEQQAAFDAMVELCTGERQASWVTATGYFPASKSAFNSVSYQALLNDTNPSALRKMYQLAGRVNHDVYDDQGWVKFVDPGFLGSNEIRTAIRYVLRNVFTLNYSSGHEGDAADMNAKITNYMNDLWSRDIDPNNKR